MRFGTGNGRISPRLANHSWQEGGTTPVGRYPANGLGLHDMSGNVGEWVRDGYARYGRAGSDNPANERSGGPGVFRGGGWMHGPRSLRCSARTCYDPSERVNDLGFRLVRVR